MGQHVVNLSTICDYATPEKDTFIELHMALRFPREDLEKVQTWRGSGDWESAEQYLSERYPEHRLLLADWLARGRIRSQGKSGTPKLVAAA